MAGLVGIRIEMGAERFEAISLWIPEAQGPADRQMGCFWAIVLNITSNTRDQKRSELAFHLLCTATTKAV